MDRNDDRYWFAGVIYVNRDDPAIVVPKRPGSRGISLGWTLNMAHPISWLLTFGPVVLITVLTTLNKR